MKTEPTYRCIGTCRRTGLTTKALNCMPGGNNCPYCGGHVVDEQTGKQKEYPELPTFTQAKDWAFAEHDQLLKKMKESDILYCPNCGIPRTDCDCIIPIN